MKYEYYNPQPYKENIGDCVVRALSKALNQSWEKTYIDLALQGFIMGNLPNADSVWGKYLINRGYERHLINDDGLGDYTVEDFSNDNPKGTYILSMPGNHVVTIVDSVLYDTWDSRYDVPTYYFVKKK